MAKRRRGKGVIPGTQREGSVASVGREDAGEKILDDGVQEKCYRLDTEDLALAREAG